MAGEIGGTGLDDANYLVVEELFRGLVVQETLAVELRTLESLARPDQRTARPAASSSRPQRREERGAITFRLLARADESVMLRALMVWRTLPSRCGDAAESVTSSSSSQLQRELAACEEALAIHRKLLAASSRQADSLRLANAELSSRLDIESLQSRTLLEAGQAAATRAARASQELLAARHEIAALQGRLALGDGLAATG